MNAHRNNKLDPLQIEFEKAVLARTDLNGWLGLLGAQMLLMLAIALFNFYRILDIMNHPKWIYFTRDGLRDPSSGFGAPSLYDPMWSYAIGFELCANIVIIVLLTISAVTYFSRSSSFKPISIITFSCFSIMIFIDLILVGSIKNYPKSLKFPMLIASALGVLTTLPWILYIVNSKWCALVFSKGRPSREYLMDKYGYE